MKYFSNTVWKPWGKFMKKCPKCKAEIQEEARFCLYCMTSFEEKQTIDSPKEKNKRWLYIIAAVLGVAIIASSVFIFGPKDSSNKGKSDNSSVTENSSSTADSNENDGTKSDNEQSNESGDNKIPDSNDDKNKNASNDGDGTNDKPTDDTSGDDTPQNDNPGDDSDTDDTTDTPPNTQPKYTYIEATFENAYPTGYSTIYAPENAIVITKVNHKEESGNYVIPDTIDGKKVAAVMPLAFSDASISSTVKSVTLPSTVRTIWGDAFKDCFNLTDLYIKSAVIGIYEDAFPASSNRNGRLTIHCKRDCRDFDFYYYRNIASRYDANYIEWNG